MKKIFNLAVILATLMGGATLTSCDDDDEKSEEKVNAQKLEYIVVEANKEYSASNESIGKAFTFKVLDAKGETPKTQSVTFNIEVKGGKDAKGLELSYTGDSYLLYTADDEFKTMGGDAIVAAGLENRVIMCLMGDSRDAIADVKFGDNQRVITSATINNKFKAKGTKTLFSVNN
jgi:hypothetical protein